MDPLVSRTCTPAMSGFFITQIIPTMSKLNPADAAKILNANLSNIIEKVRGKKTLNASERAQIQAVADGEEHGGAQAWAANIVELAEAIGCSRQAVHRWKKLKRNAPPETKSDGRLDVVAWKAWLRETGRAGGLAGDDMADELPRLNAKRLLLINERLELDNGERRGELISRAEVIRECAEIATTLRGNLYGQAAGICGEVMKMATLDEAVKHYNDAVDRILFSITAGLKCARKPEPKT